MTCPLSKLPEFYPKHFMSLPHHVPSTSLQNFNDGLVVLATSVIRLIYKPSFLSSATLQHNTNSLIYYQNLNWYKAMWREEEEEDDAYQNKTMEEYFDAACSFWVSQNSHEYHSCCSAVQNPTPKPSWALHAHFPTIHPPNPKCTRTYLRLASLGFYINPSSLSSSYPSAQHTFTVYYQKVRYKAGCGAKEGGED